MKNLDSVFAAYLFAWGIFFFYYLSEASRAPATSAQKVPRLLRSPTHRPRKGASSSTPRKLRIGAHPDCRLRSSPRFQTAKYTFNARCWKAVRAIPQHRFLTLAAPGLSAPQ